MKTEAEVGSAQVKCRSVNTRNSPDNTSTVSLRRPVGGFSYFGSNVHTKFLIEMLSGPKKSKSHCPVW